MRLHRLAITASLLLGYVFVYFFYQRGVVTPRQFLAASIMVMLAFLTVFYLSKPPGKGVEFAKLEINEVLLILLPYSVFTLTFLELWLQGRSGFLTIFSLILVLSFLIFSRKVFLAVIAAITILASFICALYGFYVPNFGVDTWRDSIQASQIIEKSGLGGLTVVHDAYPFPLVSILYAIVAMIVGFDALWASSLMGLLYLFLLSLWIFIVARHAKMPYPHLSVLLVFTIPHVVMWSTSFIPQAYAVLASIPLLFLNFNIIVTLLLSISVVMGHGGLALFTLICFIYLSFIQYLFGKRARNAKSVRAKTAVFALLFALYVAYAIASAISGGIFAVINALYNFLTGSTNLVEASTAVSSVYLWNLIVDIAPYTILLLLGFITIVELEDSVSSSYTLFAMAGLSIAILTQTYAPGLDLIRYVGMQSSIILAIMAPKSLSALTSRGHMGTVYAVGALLIALISFGFGGALMPGSPYVSSFYTGTFSSGSLKYVEALELRNLMLLLTSSIDYVTDLKSGLYMGYNCVWLKYESTGIFILERGIRFLLGGYYFTITPEYLEQSHVILIFRESGLRILKAYSADTLPYLESKKNQLSLIYKGENIETIYFANK